MTRTQFQWDVETQYAQGMSCPTASCPGEGQFIQWAWHGRQWRELVVCDVCHTRFYTGAIRRLREVAYGQA